MTTRGNAQEDRAATVAELRNAVETILSGVRESVLAMRERAADDRDHYDDMFGAVHRRFDRVEIRLDEIDRRRPTIGFGGGGEAGQPT
ncbi:MAG: hypothetical protein OXI39_14875 [Gemmatimonadota bacterium]|uniref:hypothetical protein n=1 Tax=Candidatus Palauibacter scopulicola TaxID=3056741 RepID=UPI0023862C2D|nr:hypothetical protein [Candidatus Palauibacter scopulicola]MDE2664268.1 hypothetical protein [Candidatus Palauibacter scopulicola]